MVDAMRVAKPDQTRKVSFIGNRESVPAQHLPPSLFDTHALRHQFYCHFFSVYQVVNFIARVHWHYRYLSALSPCDTLYPMPYCSFPIGQQGFLPLGFQKKPDAGIAGRPMPSARVVHRCTSNKDNDVPATSMISQFIKTQLSHPSEHQNGSTHLNMKARQ